MKKFLAIMVMTLVLILTVSSVAYAANLLFREELYVIGSDTISANVSETPKHIYVDLPDYPDVPSVTLEVKYPSGQKKLFYLPDGSDRYEVPIITKKTGTYEFNFMSSSSFWAVVEIWN